MKTIVVYCTNTVKYIISEEHIVSFDDKRHSTWNNNSVSKYL